MMEYFVSGYCRVLDASRLVAVELEQGTLQEADCQYPDCPYAVACQVGKKIGQLLEEA